MQYNVVFLKLYRVSSTGKHVHACGQFNMPRDLRLSVMVTTQNERSNISINKPLHFSRKIGGSLHAGEFAVVKVTGNDQRIDLFREAQVNDAGKGSAGCIGHQLGQLRIFQGQGSQGRVQMNISGMNEAKCH